MGTLVRTAAVRRTSIEVTYRLEPQPESVRVCRRLVHADISETAHVLNPQTVDDALLTASELLTNVVRHAYARQCLLLVKCSSTRIGLGVADDRPDLLPYLRDCTDASTSGRGLYLVGKLAHSWGCKISDSGDWKTVWAVFYASSQVPAQSTSLREEEMCLKSPSLAS